MSRKIEINIYKGLPMVQGKIRFVALAAVMGRTPSWISNKLWHLTVNNKKAEFTINDLQLVNSSMQALGDEIEANIVEYCENREKIIAQIKILSGLVSMPYIYTEVLKVKKSWYTNRTKSYSDGYRVSSFSEDDIIRINMAAMQIANELRSLEFTL